jgi:hypothetical protein
MTGSKEQRQAQKERSMTAARVRELLNYDLDTGVFTWRHSRRGLKAGAVAGRISGAGYWQLCIDSAYFYAHRVAWLYVTGEWPKSQIDHIDLDKKNNRFANLRNADRVQNQGNRPMSRHNASGIKGVRWNRHVQKWQARLTDDGRDRHLGHFDNITEASAAYQTAATKKFGSFARVS